MDKKLLLEKIEASRREVLDAEERLTSALRETRSAPRADKTTVTDAVREAISKLRAARTDLEDVGRIVIDDETT